jgi:hypothetical protein
VLLHVLELDLRGADAADLQPFIDLSCFFAALVENYFM